MIRHSSIALGLMSLALLASPARADEAPLYTNSVLYRGDPVAAAGFIAADILDWTAADSTGIDSSGSGTSSSDSLSALHLALSDSLHTRKSSSFGAAFVGAFIGTAALGLAGGAIAAAAHEDSGSEDDWEEIGFIVGGVYAGVVAGSSAGAHLANGRRGAYGSDVLAGLGAGIVSIPFIAVGPVGWFVGTVVQSALVALSEHNSAKRHAREAAARSSSEP